MDRTLHSVVAGSGNNIHLLLSGQVDEFYSVTRYTDGEVCVLRFLRMLHSVDELLGTEYVYVQMMSTLIEVAVQNVSQVESTLFVIMAQCARVDGLGIGNTVQSQLIRQFCNRVQGSQKTGLLCSVGGVSSRRKGLTCFSSVWQYLSLSMKVERSFTAISSARSSSFP